MRMSLIEQNRVDIRKETTVTINPVALVEEIQAKVYDVAKARMLTLLEVALGNEKGGLGSSPAGRMLDYLLADVKEAVLDVGRRHGADVSPAALEQARQSREEAHRANSLHSARERAWMLEQELSSLRTEVGWREAEERRETLMARIGGLNAQDMKRVEEAVRKVLS